MNNRNKAISIIILIVLFLIGYGAGRYALPAKVIVTEKVVTQVVEKQVVVTKVDTQIKTIYVKEAAKDTHTETVTTKEKDGTVVTKVVEDTHLKTEVKDNVVNNTTSNTFKVDDKKSLTEKETTTTTIYSKPAWSVAVMPGYDFSGKASDYLLPTLPVKHLMVGVAVDHRFIGPISLGAWANTSGAGGLSIRLEF